MTEAGDLAYSLYTGEDAKATDEGVTTCPHRPEVDIEARKSIFS